MEEIKKLVEEVKAKTLSLKEASEFGTISFNVDDDEHSIKLNTKKDFIDIEFLIKGGKLFKYKGSFEGFAESFESFCKNSLNDKPDFKSEFYKQVTLTMESIYGENIDSFLHSPSEGFITDLIWSCARVMENLRNYKEHIKYHGKYGISLLSNAPYFIDGKSHNPEKYKIVPMFRTEEDAKIAHELVKPYIEKVYGRK